MATQVAMAKKAQRQTNKILEEVEGLKDVVVNLADVIMILHAEIAEMKPKKRGPKPAVKE